MPWSTSAWTVAPLAALDISVAIGRQHGFGIQVFGETGGLRWASEQPNQLIYTPVGGRTQIIEKGEGGLHEDAQRLSRVSIAHPEGFPLAVANIYCDLGGCDHAAKCVMVCQMRLTVCGLWRRFTLRWHRRKRMGHGWTRAPLCFAS